MSHAAFIMATTWVAIIAFLGLATYVPTRFPNRPISWIFGLFCLTVATVYLTSFFMVSDSQPSTQIGALILRIRWVAITYGSVLYFHLISFYFSPGWQRHRLLFLSLVYFSGTGLAMAILFTDYLVAGPLPRSAPHIIGANPGPLMPLLAAFFFLVILASLVGLIDSYRVSPFLSFRHHLRILLWPIALILASSAMHWAIIFTETAGQIPHELPDTLLILAAVLYARSVIQDGSFVGRPISPRELLYATLAILFGFAIIYLTLALDRWLISYRVLPFPIATGILVLVVVASYPVASRWITSCLDRWLFKAEHRQKILAQELAGALTGIPSPDRLRAQLLESICAILDVQNGYLARTDSDLPQGELIVEAVRGDPTLQIGTTIRRPLLAFNRPEPVSALPSPLQSRPDWQNIVLFYPFELDQTINGLVALGEKRTGTPFNREELLLCTELIKQLKAITQILPFFQKRNFYSQTARLQNEALAALGRKVVEPARSGLKGRGRLAPPLQIRLLGPIQIIHEDRLLPESAWGSEKAKSMLAYLLWKSPAGVTRAELCQALWPERSVAETANVFHVTVHRLRRALQSENGRDRSLAYIQCERERYRFNTDLPHWLDTSEFERLIQHQDSASLRAAVALYRGSYLEDMAWALPPEVEAQRRNFEQLYADSLRRLIAQTDGREAVLYLEKLLVVEPADELANQALVLSYLAQGRNDLAQIQLARWQDILVDFNLECTSEITEFWQMVSQSRTPSG